MRDTADIASVLARTVASLRAERGWSLDQLAARSGVSKGVLVAVEQGRSNPSLGTLARMSDAFGVPVPRLIDTTHEPEVRISGPADMKVLWRSEAGGIGTIIAATSPPWSAELWRWTLQPGDSFGGDPHAPASREMAWVETGTLTLTVAGRRYQVEPGGSARFHGDVPHSYANEGSERVIFTMVDVIPPSPDR